MSAWFHNITRPPQAPETGGMPPAASGPGKAWAARWSAVIRANRPDFDDDQVQEALSGLWKEWSHHEAGFRLEQPQLGEDELLALLSEWFADAGLTQEASMERTYRHNCLRDLPDATPEEIDAAVARQMHLWRERQHDSDLIRATDEAATADGNENGLAVGNLRERYAADRRSLGVINYVSRSARPKRGPHFGTDSGPSDTPTR